MHIFQLFMINNQKNSHVKANDIERSGKTDFTTQPQL